MTEVYVDQLVAKCDAPDVLDGGTSTLSAPTQTVNFNRSYQEPPAVTLTAVGSSGVQLVSVAKTGFVVSGIVGTAVNWSSKGV